MVIDFSTKARTLKALSGILHSSNVLPMVIFSVRNWQDNPIACLREITAHLCSDSFIVRSSCHNEDGLVSSEAGVFLSLSNVTKSGLADAVQQVIASYHQENPDDEILIQPTLSNVVRSGVAFSHDPNTCSPYRIINWSEGFDTTAVTSGVGGRVWQQAAMASREKVEPPEEIKSVLLLIDELLDIFGNKPLDCEFAYTTEKDREVLWLLQARPLILPSAPQSEMEQSSKLKNISEKISRGMQEHPFLLGRRTVYGVMPDWNPAEIIGTRPKPLALSLYRELITDSIWAYQRNNYGYRNLRSFPLMPHFYGLPYIDVRLSFNSFIPADLEDDVAARLVDFYVDRLLAEPALHDKVEFEIVFSCYTFDLQERLECLSGVGFSEADREAISASLRVLTNGILHPNDGLWQRDAEKIDILNKRREELNSATPDAIERIYWLLEDGKRYGTLPFAGLARAGFVAVQMLKSMVSVGLLTQSEYESFLGGITTVGGQLARDRSFLDKTSFIAQYGHLRPGTYDILSARYDEAADFYFDWSSTPTEPDFVDTFSLTLAQMRELSSLLKREGLDADPVEILTFMQKGIELRELAKFHFSKNLSDILLLIGEFGKKYGFSREDLAFSDIAAFKELYVAAVDPAEVILHSVAEGKARYAETVSLSLPQLISKPEDVWGFEWAQNAPNFITQEQVTAPVVTSDNRKKLSGSIVCIPSADPGFDWLFAYPIAGLITAWGGTNSHMAIRAGERRIPAVIGAGEMLYRKWSGAKRIYIDCAGRRVEVIE
jgi:phosphohistidine swiveling domain-containing protein